MRVVSEEMVDVLRAIPSMDRALLSYRLPERVYYSIICTTDWTDCDSPRAQDIFLLP